MVSLGAVEEAVGSVLDNKEIEIAAVALPDEKKGEKIVILVSGELELAFLKQKLMEQKVNPLMLPDALIIVDSIPKLGGGKTDFFQAKELALSHDSIV